MTNKAVGTKVAALSFMASIMMAAGFLAGCVTTSFDTSPSQADLAQYPKASPDADIVMHLESNKDKTSLLH